VLHLKGPDHSAVYQSSARYVGLAGLVEDRDLPFATRLLHKTDYHLEPVLDGAHEAAGQVVQYVSLDLVYNVVGQIIVLGLCGEACQLSSLVHGFWST